MRPFGPEDIDSAAALLAARHARDRLQEPRLPRKFELQARCRELLADIWPRASGVVAERNGGLVGYLVAECAAPSSPERRAFIGLEGHAVAVGEDAETYRHMYAALAPLLIKRGLFDHQVLVPAADTATIDAWFTLTFGRMIHVSTRDTAPLETGPGAFEVRACRREDLDTVASMLLRLDHFHATPPIFRPTTATIEAARAEIADDIDARESLILLALDSGKPAGLFLARPPRSMVMGRFEKTLAVLEVYTAAEARGSGAATALLSRGLVWARARHYEHLALDFMTANPLSSRFWTGHGFRPVTTILQRRLDPRLAWADGSNE